MIKTNPFLNEFSEVLKSEGFLRKKRTWYLRGDDVVVVLNLQSSDFEKKYYINFGVWLKSLGEDEFPSENKCHIQSRLTSLFNEEASLIDRACRIVDPGLGDFSDFLAFASKKVVPFCRDCLSLDSLKNKIERGEFNNSLIFKELKLKLGLI
jgi:hypothetical protein